VSYHLIVHLKAKGTATLWPDKVAVLHAWSRRSPSLGFSPWKGQSVGHVVALTVASRSPCRSYGLRQIGMLTLSLVSGDARCSTSLSRHRQQSGGCVGDSQGPTPSDPVAVRS